MVALVLDGGVEHRDEPVEDVGPRPLDERRDLVRVLRLGGLALGLPRDDRLQVADGTDHDAPAAVGDRLAMLVPSERAAAHLAEVDRDLREECGLFGECGRFVPADDRFIALRLADRRRGKGGDRGEDLEVAGLELERLLRTRCR